MRPQTSALSAVLAVAWACWEGVAATGGAELYFDGVDDFIAAFPNFDVLTDWTIEAWVQPSLTSWSASQCLFHQSTYYASNILTLEAREYRWRLRYGGHELLVGPSTWGKTPLASAGHFTTDQHHVAITHSDAGGGNVALRVYLNGTLAASADVPKLDIQEPLFPFLVGACNELTTDGLLRTYPFGGHVDEVRYWSQARSQSQIQESMHYTGPASRWPAGLSVTGLQTQYNLDQMYDIDIPDTSGNGKHGIRGGWGVTREMPRYQRSVFGSLLLGAEYHEVRRVNATGIACPSSNCFDLASLLPEITTFRVLSVPANSDKGVYLALQNGTRLSPGLFIGSDVATFVVEAAEVVSYDAFEVQLCINKTAAQDNLDAAIQELNDDPKKCDGQPVRVVSFRVLDSRPPTAGETYNVQLLGDGGYLELRDGLAESGTVEFWAQLQHLDAEGRQTLFSVTHSVTGMPILTLGLSNGEMVFHFCTVQPMGFDGEKPFTVKMPELRNLDPQHIAISWQYQTSVRGRAVYVFHVFRNCELLRTMPQEVQDSCVHFGSTDDEMLKFPTFGQSYQVGPQGLVLGAFATAYLADIRIWSRAVPQQDICSRQRGLLLGTEPGLTSLFPIAAEDARRNDRTVANRVPGASPADLRCTGSQLACPSMEKARGYALRPSVFALPAEPLHFVTSAGRVDGSNFLPPLELSFPAFDRDNYEAYTLESKDIDETNIFLSRVPESDCGSLQKFDTSTNIFTDLAAGETVLNKELPLFFIPNRNNASNVDSFACSTSVAYYAIDTDGVQSPFSVEIRIAVRISGPLVTAVELFDPGVSDDVTDAGDIIAVRFDRPTTGVKDWRGIFDVRNGSLGSAEINATWSDAGDALMLQLVSDLEGIRLVPGSTKFYFNGNLTASLRTAGSDSYPCLDLSPAMNGSFNYSYCSAGMVFSKQLARCIACGEGNRVSADGLHCLACSQGTYGPMAASTACLPCEPGRYLPPGSTNRSQCLLADPGMYVVESGQWFQIQCPHGMVSEVPGSVLCQACPAGALCETAAHFHSWAVPMDGHFRFSSRDMMRCLIPTACKGGWDVAQQANVCESGMGGPLCQGCLDGWWRPHDKPRGLCIECGWAAWGRVVLFIVLSSLGVWILSILSVDAALWGGMHSVIIRLALNYFTAVSLLARLEYWELSPALGEFRAKTLTSIFDISLRFDGGLLASLMGLECLFGKLSDDGQSTKDGQWPIVKNQILFWSLFPVIWISLLMLVSLLAFEVRTRYSRFRAGIRREIIAWWPGAVDDSDDDAFKADSRFLGLIRDSGWKCACCARVRHVLKDSTPLVVTSYFLSLPTLLRVLVTTLSCEPIGGEEEQWRLLIAPDVACWEGDHLPWAIVAIVAIFIWGCLVPALMTLFLWVKRFTLIGKPQWTSLLGFLCGGYEIRFVHWEGVVHLRRVLFILVGMWPELPRTSELTLYQIVASAAILTHLSFKPFDNRGGELLDEIELYGLCNFLLLATATQLVLLADPDGADYDLIPVMFTGALITISTLLLSQKTLDEIVQAALIVFFLALIILSNLGTYMRQMAAFVFITVALVSNLLFILWLLKEVLMESFNNLVEARARSRRKKEEKELGARESQAALAKGSKKRKSSNRTSQAELDMHYKKEKPMLEKSLEKVFASARPTSGALIRFDAEAGELVLGLHPDTYMHDPQFSAYTRRLFARLGPFLTDEEREFVAMALADAVRHVIVECDYDIIDVRMLEFLIRITFAWKYQRRESMGELEELDGTIKPMVWGEDNEEFVGRSMSKSSTEKRSAFFELLFDDKIFKHGMTAADFQEEMHEITTMKEKDVQDLLTRFLNRHTHEGLPLMSTAQSLMTQMSTGDPQSLIGMGDPQTLMGTSGPTALS